MKTSALVWEYKGLTDDKKGRPLKTTWILKKERASQGT